MGLLRALWDLRPEDLEEAGGKALGLARLADLGVEVPAGFVVTASFFEIARSGAPVEPEAEALARKIPEDLGREIEAALDALGPSPAGYAVRSSAPEEDSRNASFAGVFESFLSVPREKVPQRLFQSWASTFGERAAAYRRRMRLPGDETSHRMAVVVQRMLAPSAAGVLFTRDPAGGDALVIQAARGGPGEARTSGSVPATLRVPRNSAFPSPPVEPVPRDGPGGEAPFPLEERLLRELVELSMRLEAAWGCPLDLEWAVEGGRLHFLQARPITALAGSGADPAEAGMAEGGREDALWTRANLRELLPDLPSPLFASLAERVDWVDLCTRLGVKVLPEDRPVRFIEGRPYFNLSLLGRWMAQYGLPITRFMQALGHGSALDGWSGPPPRLLRALVGSPGRFTRLALIQLSAPGRLRRFFERSRSEAARLARLNPASLPDATLADLLHASHRVDTELLFHLLIAFNRVSGILFLAERLLSKRAEQEAFLGAVLAAGEKSVSVQQGTDLLRLARTAGREERSAAYLMQAAQEFTQFEKALEGTEFLQAFQAYLAEYGHRGIHESDPAMPLYREEPAFLLRAIAGVVADPHPPDPEARAREQEATASRAWRDLRRALPGWERLLPARAIILKGVVAELKEAIRTRERTRFEGMRIQAELRRFLRESGRRLARRGCLDTAGELPYLRIEEIEAALRGSAGPAPTREIAARRRAEQERQSRMPMPNLLRDSEIPYLAARSRESRPDARMFQGLPVGPGRVEGRVLILDTPRRLQEVQRGDILVAPTLDPSWIPLFNLVSGLVVELGGTLSHGSIIAREYGLPTVANLPGITRILKTGDRVLLDGSAGTLRRLGPDS